MPVVKKDVWDHQVKINDDPYGGACIKIAEKVMEYLDNEPGGFDARALICRADTELDYGITMFMACAAANLVSKVHSRGEEFRLRWNGEHGVQEANCGGGGGGVVNPAIIEKGDK